jgi:hypothetical protein
MEYINIFNTRENKRQIWGGFKNRSNNKWESEVEENFIKNFTLNKTTFQAKLFKKSIKNKNEL